MGLLRIAYLEGDKTAEARELQWATGNPDEYKSLLEQAYYADYLGQRRKAAGLRRRSIDLSKQRDLPSLAATILTTEAMVSAALGDCEGSRLKSREAIGLDRDTQTLSVAATAMGLCGDAPGALKLVDEGRRAFPDDTLNNQLFIPTVQAAIEIKRGAWQAAIDALQPAKRYDRVNTYPVYLRALALLRSGQKAEASAEFERIVTHRAAYWQDAVLIPLSQLGIARAAAQAGDKAKAKKAYADFLTLWKDADPDLPVIGEARKELAALQ
jgi:predicted Zn-dependent protease